MAPAGFGREVGESTIAKPIAAIQMAFAIWAYEKLPSCRLRSKFSTIGVDV